MEGESERARASKKKKPEGKKQNNAVRPVRIQHLSLASPSSPSTGKHMQLNALRCCVCWTVSLNPKPSPAQAGGQSIIHPFHPGPTNTHLSIEPASLAPYPT